MAAITLKRIESIVVEDNKYYVLMILLLLGFGRYIYAMIVRLILQRKKYKAKENHMELGCYHKAVRAI